MSAQNAAAAVRTEHLEKLAVLQSKIGEVEAEVNVGPRRRVVAACARRRTGFVAIFLLRNKRVRAGAKNYRSDQHALREKFEPTTLFHL